MLFFDQQAKLFPAEIRAPAGTLAGVSGYQIQFSSSDIFTPGDEVDTLVAMNPAALRTNLPNLKKGGILIVNEDAFEENDLKKAGYAANPLEDDSLKGYRLIRVPINKLNSEAVKPAGLTVKQADLCKNFFALGLVYWLYGRPLDPTLKYIDTKFAKKNPQVAQANTLTLKAGYHFGETAELFTEHYIVEKAQLPPGKYRKITGNEAVVIGLVAAGKLSGKELFYASYPITPASSILEGLAELKNFGVVTFQAEDEICAMGAAIGAAFGGALGVTGTSSTRVGFASPNTTCTRGAGLPERGRDRAPQAHETTTTTLTTIPLNLTPRSLRSPRKIGYIALPHRWSRLRPHAPTPST
jgi:2-oxoglutarate ferredoxin oxidoreductase subunit alpha